MITKKEFTRLFDMSQKEFEDYTGYSQSTLYNLFTGKIPVKAETRKAIAEKLRVRIKELHKKETLEVHQRCLAREEILRFIETGEEDI